MSELLRRQGARTGVALAIAAVVAGGCDSGAGSTEGRPTATTSPDTSVPPQISAVATGAPRVIFKGMVTHSLDHTRRDVGVQTYAGPMNGDAVGWFPGKAIVGTDCVARNGRTVRDTDVPPDTQAVVSHDWYRIIQNPAGETIRPEWIGDGYFDVQTPGDVPGCTPAQIAGTDY